jgi:glycerol-3-phosphate dehydrogenase
MYVEEALANGAKIINHAKVTKVLFENKKAVGVEFQKGNQNIKHLHRRSLSQLVG